MKFFTIQEVDASKCSACEECVQVCPKDCFEIIEADGKIYANFVNEDKCNSCAKCLVACSDDAIVLKEIDKSKFEVHIKPEKCEACETCVKISHGKEFEMIEVNGKIVSTRVHGHEGDKVNFCCPHGAVEVVEKKSKKYYK